MWGQRKRAGWGQVGQAERGKFIILTDGAVHCLINTALSSSFLSSPPFYDTWSIMKPIKHATQISICHAHNRNSHTSAWRGRKTHHYKSKMWMNGLKSGSLSSPGRVIFFFFCRCCCCCCLEKLRPMTALFLSMLRSNNIVSSTIQNRTPTDAKCSKCHCYWTDLSRSIISTFTMKPALSPSTTVIRAENNLLSYKL